MQPGAFPSQHNAGVILLILATSLLAGPAAAGRRKGI